MSLLLSSSPQHKMRCEEGIMGGDKYRASLHLEGPTVEWRMGKPPNYEAVNKLFEEGRTKVWPKGTVEEQVQNIVKSLQMEFAYKTTPQDFKNINLHKFIASINGRTVSCEEALKLGSFNTFLKNPLPEEFHYFKPQEETSESTHNDFNTCFPRGFAWEVIEVYSPPPLIAYKFRHWGFFEGPYKSHSPTGEMVEFFGMGILKVDSSWKAEEGHVFFDPAELFGGLLKGKKTGDSSASACPLFDRLK
ncbi:hypothetical protein SDJN03_24610, partial [Cucurbita argyrosperma subsp. sororia]